MRTGVALLAAGGTALAVAGASVVALAAPQPSSRSVGATVQHEVLTVARTPAPAAVTAANPHEHRGHAELYQAALAAAEKAAAKQTKAPKPNRKAEKAQAQSVAKRPPPGGPSPSGPLGIPQRAMSAYRLAADVHGARCTLGWEAIAAVGRAESGHANGGQLYPDGTTWEPILGPVLNGSGFAAIRDTDGGRFDGDKEWDRAVGPMQFIPGTWQWIGLDGDGDGRADPSDIDDAAAGTARYLCVHGGDLSDRAQLREALLRYNASSAYADAVLAWADAYAGRATVVPDPEPPTKNATSADEGAGRTAKRDVSSEPDDSEPSPTATATATPAPSSEPTPTATPTPTPTSEPTATPTAEPTATPTAEPTATPTAEPTPTPTTVDEPPADGDDATAG